MSGNIKTKVSDASVADFINSVDNETRRMDGFALLEMFATITGQQPKMWGTSIIGFGQYHYKSERSKQEGDWPITGFSPRKQNLTLYVMNDLHDYAELLSKLGKHKTTRGCLYLNKLSDVDQAVLRMLIKQSYKDMKQAHNA
mgnify:FL=1